MTNESILTLCAESGHKVERRRITLDEWREGAASGEITEAFAVGTAAVIAPIGKLKASGFTIENPPVTLESLSMRIRAQLTGIQNGEVADSHNWMLRLA